MGGPRFKQAHGLPTLTRGRHAVCTCSVLASLLPSSQLPAMKLYGVKAYPLVTLMSVVVFLTLPATVMSGMLFKRCALRQRPYTAGAAPTIMHQQMRVRCCSHSAV